MATLELFAQDEDKDVTPAEMKMHKMTKTKCRDGSDKRDDGEKKKEKKEKKKKKRKEHKIRKDDHKEEIESETEHCVKKDEEKEEIEPETEPCVEKDEEMQMQEKKNDNLSEGLHRKSHKRGTDSGKEKKKKKKQKVEDSRESSCLPINKEKKRKKTKFVEDGSPEKVHEGGAGLRENGDIASPSKRLSPKGSSKKVSFSDDVEIFPLVDGQSSEKTKQDDGLIRGKRFSKEEDEMVKKAVLEYIEEHGLGDEGLKKVLHCREFPEVKNCWKDIGKALSWRPYLSVYYRAHILFERDDKRKWTPEEYELVRKFHDKHGSDWKVLADALGKHRFHVKDTWRRIKLPNMKKGHWTQDEYQKLFDLVNTDLRLKAFEEKKSKHGMLRDNICWGAISDKLSTRSTALCCQKWYRQLTSPMVAEDEWADVDDYHLIDALSSLDACSIEDVEWDQLLDHRNGDICRKRWSQMVKHIGESANKSFSEQVEVLSKRYSIDVLDAREAYDSAPIVD
ncbi:cyclin-D-binding Myb-like transcription factor 1 isoform X2 [Momordica charantia]|nr:cyclin-D-binding Myb-like transcription factor 1 isoform X2 [Momordica charantia]XP_022147288.1 cyclin-D-binding Myb-like transcription factor 1 isoform X2 [Momordica charantia]